MAGLSQNDDDAVGPPVAAYDQMMRTGPTFEGFEDIAFEVKPDLIWR